MYIKCAFSVFWLRGKGFNFIIQKRPETKPVDGLFRSKIKKSGCLLNILYTYYTHKPACLYLTYIYRILLNIKTSIYTLIKSHGRLLIQLELQ